MIEKNGQHADEDPIGAASTEAMNNYSHVEVDDLDDFDTSDFDSEEILNEYFATFYAVRESNRW